MALAGGLTSTSSCIFSPYFLSPGVFRDKVWSEVDTASWILDQSPHTVYASGSAQIESVERAADLDSVAVTMTYPSGALAIIDVRRTERTSLNRVEVGVYDVSQFKNV